MQKNFKLILSITTVLISGSLALSQENQENKEKVAYKDVILDGKPAKLNIATGEIKFVNPSDKKEAVKFDDYVAQSNKKAKGATIKNSITSAASSSNSQPTIHTVKEGENLLKIAIRYGVTLTDLKRANNLETTLVKKGQKLRVSQLDAIEAKPKVESQPTYLSNVSNAGFHIVEKGQTLYSLGKRYGLTVDELKQFNGLSSNLIKVGQKLLLTNSNGENSDDTVSSWRVVRGDTLYSISINTGTPVEELKRINGLKNNIIKVGQQIDFKTKSSVAKK